MELKPGYKMTEVGVIPEDWDVVGLGDLNPFVTSGSRGWASYYSEQGDLFIRITNLTRTSIYLDLKNCKFVKLPPESHEGTRTQLKENDVLISITADIGIVGYVDECVPVPAYINQHIALVRFNPLFVSGKFISYFLASEHSQKLFLASTDTGAKAGMSLLTVKKIQTALPPLPEQRAIAQALSDVDALLAALDQLIAKKRDIKQAAMQQLLTGETRLPGFGGEWEVTDFDGIVEKFVGGGTPSRANKTYWGGDIPWVTVKDFSSFKPRESQEYITKIGLINSASNLIPKGTLITSTRMALGKAVVYEIDVAINQDLKALLFKQGIAVTFMLYWFNFFEKIINDLGGGSTVKGISIVELKRLRVFLPKENEQIAIASILSDMDTELLELEARRNKTRNIKQAMMQELLTGKTRLVGSKVQDIVEEVR